MPHEIARHARPNHRYQGGDTQYFGVWHLAGRLPPTCLSRPPMLRIGGGPSISSAATGNSGRKGPPCSPARSNLRAILASPTAVRCHPSLLVRPVRHPAQGAMHREGSPGGGRRCRDRNPGRAGSRSERSRLLQEPGAQGAGGGALTARRRGASVGAPSIMPPYLAVGAGCEQANAGQ